MTYRLIALRNLTVFECVCIYYFSLKTFLCILYYIKLYKTFNYITTKYNMYIKNKVVIYSEPFCKYNYIYYNISALRQE